MVVKNIGTNAEFTTQTTDDGMFAVPSLTQGVYTVTASAAGFKTTVAQNVKIDVAKTSNLEIALEVGQVNETVVVAGGADVLRIPKTSVSLTITGRQIVQVPFADAADASAARARATWDTNRHGSASFNH